MKAYMRQQKNTRVITRASDTWVPDISDWIDEATLLSERVTEQLPEIEERVERQVQVYEQGQQLVRILFAIPLLLCY